jgi:orotidine-5'-phosphate decarboxylase
MYMNFKQKLDEAVTKNNSLLCVGLDPDLSKLPKHLTDDPQPYFKFNKAIIDATADLVCAFKPNPAFYESRGPAGIEELDLTCRYLQDNYPHIPVIIDAKRGDIGNTNQHYATAVFDLLGADAITVHPYFGKESLQPFLNYKDKGIIIMCKSSNLGSDELQSLLVEGHKLYLYLADQVKQHWNENGNCLLMVGATYPEDLAEARRLVGSDMVFLVPGVGAQSGNTEATVRGGLNSQGRGLILNSSRDIIYAGSGEDFTEKARARALEVRDMINSFRGV